MNNNFTLIEAVRIILKWKNLILGLTLLSGIISAAVALWILPVYYKSTSSLYPLNQGITDRSTLFATQASESRVDYFGTKNDANRILSLANSAPIVDFMVNHFELAEHYRIDKDKKFWRHKAKKKFKKNYSAIKTERDAISITILDEDPVKAAEMVNLLVSKIDEFNKQPVIENKIKLNKLFKSKLDDKQEQVRILTDSVAFLSQKYNIKETIVNEDIVVRGNDSKGVELFKVVKQKQLNTLEDLNTLSTLSEQYEISAKENVPSIYVLEKAYVADRKSKPIRSLVVLTTMLITFFTAIIGVLVIDQYQKLMQAVNEG
ncbi:MAG: hypothetical protein HKN92_12650 [Chitinophagales bacterium]|nr:hypothetical protein [Chitinophagales bacterium]